MGGRGVNEALSHIFLSLEGEDVRRTGEGDEEERGEQYVSSPCVVTTVTRPPGAAGNGPAPTGGSCRQTGWRTTVSLERVLPGALNSGQPLPCEGSTGSGLAGACSSPTIVLSIRCLEHDPDREQDATSKERRSHDFGSQRSAEVLREYWPRHQSGQDWGGGVRARHVRARVESYFVRRHRAGRARKLGNIPERVCIPARGFRTVGPGLRPVRPNREGPPLFLTDPAFQLVPNKLVGRQCPASAIKSPGHGVQA